MKHFVMDVIIDLFVMDLPEFNIGGWNILQSSFTIVDQNSNQRFILYDTVFGTTFCALTSEKKHSLQCAIVNNLTRMTK